MVVCIPARDAADEIVGIMAMQLLRRAGHNASALPIASVSTMLEQAEQLHPDVICISALPPFAAVQAKSLCKQLRRRCRDTKIFLGLWEYPDRVTALRSLFGRQFLHSLRSGQHQPARSRTRARVLIRTLRMQSFNGIAIERNRVP